MRQVSILPHDLITQTNCTLEAAAPLILLGQYFWTSLNLQESCGTAVGVCCAHLPDPQTCVLRLRQQADACDIVIYCSVVILMRASGLSKLNGDCSALHGSINRGNGHPQFYSLANKCEYNLIEHNK